MGKWPQKIIRISKNSLIMNSSWGIISQLLQSILLSLFFIIIARSYSTTIFANFIIANVLYQLIAAFSSLGFSQLFIREITDNDNKQELINRFLKLQIYLGIAFYIINIGIGFMLYDERQLRILIIFLGINIIFDNVINAIKCINISEFKQNKSLKIFVIDAFLKFAVTCTLFLYPLTIITLTILLVAVRFITLNLFINIGCSKEINLRLLLLYKIPFTFIKNIILSNWPFIIIGSISIINWRISTIIISKTLSAKDVTNYEISFRIFSIALMLPVVVTASIFPVLIKHFKNNRIKEFNSFYRLIHSYYMIFGILAFTFIYSFIDYILPVVFGPGYAGTGIYTKQIFLTMLIFPTAFLQANVLTSMKLEKLDMWLNIGSLLIFLTLSLVGLHFIKSLSVINISIFTGFVFFHVMQDFILINKKVGSIKHVLSFYILSIIMVGSYILLSSITNPIFLFISFWLGILFIFIYVNKKRNIFNSNILFKPTA